MRIVADTEEKRKIVGYLNSQNNLLGRRRPLALRLARDYILWPYLFGRSEKREKIFHEVAREIGYEGPYTNKLYNGEVSIIAPALIGLIEGLIPSIPIGMSSWPKFLATMSAFSVVRGLSVQVGYNSKFRGKVKL